MEQGEKAMEGKTEKRKGRNQREEIRVLRKRTLVGSEKLPIYD
jgi:hypothetical protein